jgi:DNA-binding response OmpR family regulator
MAQLENRKTILLAEDYDGLRYAVATHLRREAFQVIEAIHGLDALHRGRDYFGSIDVLVTDLTMPHLTGKAVANALRVHRPQLPVLFVTGEPIESVKDGLGPKTAYLRKPYDLADVVAKIRELLIAPNPGAVKA